MIVKIVLKACHVMYSQNYSNLRKNSIIFDNSISSKLCEFYYHLLKLSILIKLYKTITLV